MAFLHSASSRYWLLAATLLPTVYVFVFILTVFSFVFHEHQAQAFLSTVEPWMGLVFVLHIVMMLINLTALVCYCIHAAKNAAFSDGLRVMWLVLLLFLFFPTGLIYWFVYLRPSGSLKKDTACLID